MAISTVSGVVSHFQQSMEIGGATNAGTGMVGSVQVLNFRIGGQPVTFKFKESGISNGDVVTAAGYMKKGTLRVLSVRNETTGALQSTPSILYWIGSICLLVLGLPLSILGVGIPIVFLGFFFAYLGWRNIRANNVLAAAPRPVTA